MKKFLVLAMLLLATTALASDPDLTIEVGAVKEQPVMTISETNWFNKIPEMKSAYLYNWAEKEGSYASLFELIKWKGFNLEAGYSPKDVAVVGVSYELANLKDLGVTVPILDLVTIQPGIAMGLGDINIKDVSAANENFYFYLNLLSVRF